MTFIRSSVSLGIVLAASLLAASSREAPDCPAGQRSAAAQPTEPPNVQDGILRDEDATPEVSTSGLRQALNDPSVVLLDARPYEEFAKGHLPGARSVPGLAGLTASQYTADAREVRKLVPDFRRSLILYCNGLYCGRSKRFAAELRKLGYTNLRRYQLGIPAWRAFGGVAQAEKDGLVGLLAADGTAVLVDARPSGEARPRLRKGRWIPPSEAPKAKDDGRLPMTDHNTRIFVVADDGAQARAAAEAIVRDAFHNVSFFAGSVRELAALHDASPR